MKKFVFHPFNFKTDPRLTGSDKLGLLGAAFKDLGANMQGGDGDAVAGWSQKQELTRLMDAASLTPRERLMARGNLRAIDLGPTAPALPQDDDVAYRAQDWDDATRSTLWPQDEPTSASGMPGVTARPPGSTWSRCF